MKKVLKRSLLVSAAINLIGILVNLISYNAFGKMPFSTTLYGGEVIEKVGFGLAVKSFYLLTAEGESCTMITRLVFYPADFLKTFVLFFVIAFVFFLIAYLLRKSRKKN